MANEEHLKILKQGAEAWNRWREKNPKIKRDLTKADLYRANLRGANYDGPQKLDRVLSVIFCVLNFILCNISQFNAIEIFRVRSFSPNALMPSLGIV